MSDRPSVVPAPISVEPTRGEDREVERLRAMHQVDFLSDPELEAEHRKGLKRICDLACALFKVESAMVSLVFENDQRFIARANLHETGTARDISFCTRAIQQDVPLVVADASSDPRFVDNPLVTGPMHLRFYAGVPLEWQPGLRIGTLCVIDSMPKQLTDDQVATLQGLAGLVLDHLRLLVAMRELRSRNVSARSAADDLSPPSQLVARRADTQPSDSTSSKGSVDQ